MSRNTVLRAGMAIPLMPIALLVTVEQKYMTGALVFSLVLLLLARLSSPIPLPGLFLILVPAAMGLVFVGLIRQEGQAK